MEWWKRSRWILAYGILYLMAFYFIEHRETKLNLIHMSLDDKIPFCEYFIVPYVLWFFFVAATLIYFVFCVESHQEYRSLAVNLGIGMTLFIVISLIYPNGQDLRPQLTGANIFECAVQYLYRIDTPTNIFPSIHVFNSLACCTALMRNENCRKHRVVTLSIIVMTILIILSTVMLKQHSLWDVFTAIVMNVFTYPFAYFKSFGALRQVRERIEKIHGIS